MRSIELKVKLKSLAEEARIIRKEERDAVRERRFNKCNDLHAHRVMVVRPAARNTLLAYQFLRGIPYRSCEASTKQGKNGPDTAAIAAMVFKYGEDYTDRKKVEPQIEAWLRSKVLEEAA